MSTPTPQPAAIAAYADKVKDMAEAVFLNHLAACNGDQQLAMDSLMAAYMVVACLDPTSTWGAGLKARRIGSELLTMATAAASQNVH